MSLLEVARGITPDFPSSAGRPFRTPDEELLARRGEIVAAARELNAAEATELAARTWRLWMAARDIDGGRSFLGEVLDGREPDESHWRSRALYGDGVFAFWQSAREDVRRQLGLDEKRRNELLRIEAFQRPRALRTGPAEGVTGSAPATLC